MAGFRLLARLSNVQERDDNCDVIDHSLLTRPPINGLLHEEVYGALSVPILIVAIDDDHHDLMV